MNDAQGSRRPPATRSPRRRGPASAPLGELEFSDWYDIPVFEPDEDERIEEIATTGRGPRRLMARARLARDARRAKRRPEFDTAGPTIAPPRPAPAPVATAPAPKPAPAPAATAPAPKPAPAPVATAPAPKPVATRPASPPEPAPPAAAVPKPPPAPVTRPDPNTWMSSGPALTEESMRLDLERESVWRRRFNDFLDRWAASEVAVAARLDHSLERVLSPSLPKSIPELLAAASKRTGSR